MKAGTASAWTKRSNCPLIDLIERGFNKLPYRDCTSKNLEKIIDLLLVGIVRKDVSSQPVQLCIESEGRGRNIHPPKCWLFGLIVTHTRRRFFLLVKLPIREALAFNTLEGNLGASRIIHTKLGTVVESEIKFHKISVKVPFIHVLIRAHKSAF